MVFRFRFGSSILGTYHLDQIEAWVLIFLFAVLFGLSMDYEVFIVSRIREAKDHGASNEEAITEGLAHTGGVVTAAAIILISALSGLVFGRIPGLQQLGVGLACGVLIDATLIRGLLLPSAMVLLGAPPVSGGPDGVGRGGRPAPGGTCGVLRSRGPRG